jgi:hypothetical protein
VSLTASTVNPSRSQLNPSIVVIVLLAQYDSMKCLQYISGKDEGSHESGSSQGPPIKEEKYVPKSRGRRKVGPDSKAKRSGLSIRDFFLLSLKHPTHFYVAICFPAILR